MMFPKKEIVEKIRKEYPKGTRVKLVRMDDFESTTHWNFQEP